MSLKIRYFAWVRERTGIDEEVVDLPATVQNASELMGWLRERGENFEAAFEQPDIIRVAYDQLHVTHDAPLADVAEIAFFPPMTGG